MDKEIKAFEYENLASALIRNEKKIYVYLAVAILFLWISLVLDIISIKKTVAFIIFAAIGAAFKYFISRYHIFIEFTPIVFFAVIVAKYMGIPWVVLYLVIADVLPSYIGRCGITQTVVLHWIWVFMFSIIAIPFFNASSVFAIAVLPLAYFAGCLFLEHFFLEGLTPGRWSSSFGNLAINFYFFIKLSEFFVAMVV